MILDFVHDLIQNEQKEFMQKIFKVSTNYLKLTLFFVELYEASLLNDERQLALECLRVADQMWWWSRNYPKDYHHNLENLQHPIQPISLRERSG